MTIAKLTAARRVATRIVQSGKAGKDNGSSHMMRKGNLAVAMMGPLALSGCINVNAPTEPIVIELNINIRQEVVYLLADDARKTIEDNADIF